MRQISRHISCGTQAISAAPRASAQPSCDQFLHPWVLAHTGHILYSNEHGAVLSTHCSCLRQHKMLCRRYSSAFHSQTNLHRRVHRRTAITARANGSTPCPHSSSQKWICQALSQVQQTGRGQQPLSQSSRTPCSRSAALRRSPWRWTWRCPAAASPRPQTAPQHNKMYECAGT